ncbi:hypothetical protein [Oryzobacter telluris]|uniref:hypothetical protein n=1 Tax=Oryzobacter telluris TaxID=3149179 RepID=UPI00370D2246
MTALLPDRGALRTRLDESAWAAAWSAADEPPVPDWARPRTGDAAAWSDATAAPDGDLVDALATRHRAVLTVDVATVGGRVGVLGELSTDLTTVLGVVRRLHVPEGGSPSAASGLPGVEVDLTTPEHLVEEVLRLLPPAPDPSGPDGLAEVELVEEHTVAFGRALRTGDRQTVDAVCSDNGWSTPPEVLLALVLELRGSAVVTIRRHGAGPLIGQWMLTRRGYVELVRTPRATVRHVPRSGEDIARTLLTALTGAVSAVLADAAVGAGPTTEDGGGTDG